MRRNLLIVLGMVCFTGMAVNVLASEKAIENNDISIGLESNQKTIIEEIKNEGIENKSSIEETDLQYIESGGWGNIEKSPSKNPVIITPLIENTLVYGNDRVVLYPTFKDKEAAFEELRNQASSLLSIISLKYSLGELSEENWKQFYDCSKEYIFDLNNGIVDTDPEPNAILYFFDIYEGYANNQKIIEKYNPINSWEYLKNCNFSIVSR